MNKKQLNPKLIRKVPMLNYIAELYFRNESKKEKT
jgi:hypothetical protein